MKEGTNIINFNYFNDCISLFNFFDNLQKDKILDLYDFYPNFNIWFNNVVIPDFIKGNRTVILELRFSKIIGVAILKHSDENKICTLNVLKEYQNKGIGIKLFELSMKYLNDDYPLLSVDNQRLIQFEKVFHHFGYTYNSEYPDLYIENNTEISFNGVLK